MISDHLLQRQKSLASTSDSCESDDPATPTPGREEAAESLASAEAEAPVAPPSPLLPNGGRGELRPRENPHRGHPPSPPSGHAPLEGGSDRGGGAGRPALEGAEAEGRRVGGAEGRAEPEGHFLRRSL